MANVSLGPTSSVDVATAHSHNHSVIRLSDSSHKDQFHWCGTCGDWFESRRPEPEKALRTIVSLWPDPDCSAELAPEFIGPNDGRIRADKLWFALNEARRALGLPTYPEPEHWNKPQRLKTYPHTKQDGTVVQVTIPEKGDD